MCQGRQVHLVRSSLAAYVITKSTFLDLAQLVSFTIINLFSSSSTLLTFKKKKLISATFSAIKYNTNKRYTKKKALLKQYKEDNIYKLAYQKDL